jgi:hypothetical protein
MPHQQCQGKRVPIWATVLGQADHEPHGLRMDLY